MRPTSKRDKYVSVEPSFGYCGKMGAVCYMAKKSLFLTECEAFVKGKMPGIIRVSEARDERNIGTAAFMRVARCQNVYSVAKTFTMTAIGLLYDRGLIRPDDPVCGILADELPQGMDLRWRNATVEMALRHRLGLPAGFLDIDVNDPSDFTDDYLRCLLTYPLAYDPDSESRYSDGAYYLLARLAEKITGMPLEDYLRRELLAFMDFKELAFSHCPKGHAIGATGLYIHSSDMAKLGLLYLNGGTYLGKRMLSEEWVRLAVSRGYALDRHGNGPAYGKGGMYGQELLVLPKQHSVVAIQAFCDDLRPLNEWLLNYKS